MGLIAEELIELEAQMNYALSEYSSFSTDQVQCIYNPNLHAYDLHCQFIRKYCCDTQKRALWVGMNPGPFGMSQTGVPFGDVPTVKNWLKMNGSVRKPAIEHPKRPIVGLACGRKEVSGHRMWTMIRQLYPSSNPQEFFIENWITNYCPLIFMDYKGANITPPSIKCRQDRHRLQAICDQYLARTLDLFNPEAIVAIGKYAQDQCRKLCHRDSRAINMIEIMHPSPVNPLANKPPGWVASSIETLQNSSHCFTPFHSKSL